MNVEELRSVQRTERQKDSLQHLRDSFYRDVADYVADRKAERKRVAAEADDPFSSPEVSRLTDEIETAEEVVESIYERRVGKIVKRATFAAAGMAAEDEGLTAEERDLFDDLVARIERNRETVLDTLAGEYDEADVDGANTADPEPTEEAAPDPTPSPPDDAGPAPDPDDLLAEAMGGSSDDADPTDAVPDESPVEGAAGPSPAESPADDPPADAPQAGPSPDETTVDATAGTPPDEPPTPDGGAADPPASDTDRTTLRITRDVGEIFGVDEREYDLASEDVVTLPTPNAEPLLDRDAAERLDAE
jgi:DNA replication factor GINS